MFGKAERKLGSFSVNMHELELDRVTGGLVSAVA